MKNKINTIFIGLLITVSTINAQTTYTFTHSTQTYSPLVSPTVVANNAGFNGAFFNPSLGFSFNYFGSPYTSITFNTDGYCSMGSAFGTYGFYTMYAGLKGLGHSQIAYQLDASGGAGNKIFKLEWKSVGFTMDATSTDSASFQIWLFETSNKVEYHFGAWSINSAHFMSLFSNTQGLFEAFDDPSGMPYYNLQGNPASPSFVHNPSTNLFLTGYPSTGTVYTFIPGSASGIDETAKNTILTIYPQPAYEYINIELNTMDYKTDAYNIVNVIGETVMSEKMSNSKIQKINISSLKSGIYFIQLISADKIIATQKFIR